MLVNSSNMYADDVLQLILRCLRGVAGDAHVAQ
jgi:hypothetical protein